MSVIKAKNLFSPKICYFCGNFVIPSILNLCTGILQNLPDSFTESRKWCEDLEDLLRCPVCFERPTGPVRQCLSGHHICEACRNQIATTKNICPTCEERFSTTARNYLAEYLSDKLDDIELSLLHPNHSLNQRNRRSAGCQTDGTAILIQKEVKKPAKCRDYCRIKPCSSKVTHSYSELIQHIRDLHDDKFYEPTNTVGDTYEQVWTMHCKKGVEVDLAIHIPEMGLFFMRMYRTVDDGTLLGNLEMVDGSTVGREFEYDLIIGRGELSKSLKRKVSASRGIYVGSHSMRRMVITNGWNLTFTLILTHLPTCVSRTCNATSY